jgi:hypothetical protein
MKMTNKEVDQAEGFADEFFQSMEGQKIGIVGLTVLFIAGGFIMDMAEDHETAMDGLDSLYRDLEAAINEAYPSLN